MTTRVVTVAPDTPVPVIASLLRDNRISGVPVTDADGAVVGLVSEYDLLAREGETAGEVMTGVGDHRQRGHRRGRRAAPAGRAAHPAGAGDQRPAAGRDRQPRRRGGAADHRMGVPGLRRGRPRPAPAVAVPPVPRRLRPVRPAGRLPWGLRRHADMTDPAVTDLTREDPAVLREYYRQMALIRAFELRAAEMYTRARIGGYCHLNLGEEATVVGLTAALQRRGLPVRHLPGARVRTGPRRRPRPGDGRAVRPRRRAVARPGRVDAPVRHRRSGCWAGTGSSADRSRWRPAPRSRSPTTTGPAPDAPAVMCLLGDATTNIGAFHESLNLAALWKLPVVYVIVNNQLGMGTPGRGGGRRAGTVETRLRLPDARAAGGRQRRARRPRRRPRRPRPGHGRSTSPRCWRRSATGCAATRWSTPPGTAPPKTPNGCAGKTRCPPSATTS